jgi:hypothetical protein
MITYLDLVVAGAVSGVQQKRTLAHAPFADDQSALFGPCGATLQIDFTYHNLKNWCQRRERSTIPTNFHPTFPAAASSVC